MTSTLFIFLFCRVCDINTCMHKSIAWEHRVRWTSHTLLFHCIDFHGLPSNAYLPRSSKLCGSLLLLPCALLSHLLSHKFGIAINQPLKQLMTMVMTSKKVVITIEIIRVFVFKFGFFPLHFFFAFSFFCVSISQLISWYSW